MKKNDNSQLILENICFAKKLAAQFYEKRPNLGFDLEDFEGAALLGLCDAARRFEPEKGMFFRTYAYFRIRGTMWDLLRESGGVQRRHFNQIIKNQNAARDDSPADKRDGSCDNNDAAGGDKPSSEKLPYTFARSIRELANLMHVIDDVDMLVHVGGDGEAELSYSNDLDPEQAAVLKSSRHFLKTLIKKLPTRQQRILELRYFESQSFDKISEELGGVSKSWVSRMHTSALDRLRVLVEQEFSKQHGEPGARRQTISVSQIL